MSKHIDAIVTEIKNLISRRSEKLASDDYREVLEETHAHIQCLLDCLDEEASAE